MTLEDLRAFVLSYQVESLSEAARSLGCTQGAVAQHVRRLEKELGVELFTRVPRGIVPTESGQTFYVGASGALGQLEMAIREIDRVAKQREGRLSLAVSTMAAAGFLRPAILALKKRRPALLLDIEPGNTAEVRLEAVRSGRADLALVPLDESTRGLDVRAFRNVELLLLVHHRHRLANRKRVRLAELATLHYIAQGSASPTFRHVDRALRQLGVTLEIGQIVEDPAAALLMVELGRGETFIPVVQAKQAESSGLAKAVVVGALPPIQMTWVARNFSLLPKVAAEFLAAADNIVLHESRDTGAAALKSSATSP